MATIARAFHPAIVLRHSSRLLGRRSFSVTAPCGNDDDGETLSLFNGPIPRDKIELSFSRSGGPGGQNVNKVNTKVDLRFKIGDADWLPAEVRAKLRETEPNRITKADELVISSSQYRTQRENIEDAFLKLEEVIAKAAAVPKEATAEQKAHVVKLARAEKERRIREKKERSEKRGNRNRRDDD